jgi:hypothetical protein
VNSSTTEEIVIKNRKAYAKNQTQPGPFDYKNFALARKSLALQLLKGLIITFRPGSFQLPRIFRILITNNI